MQRVLHERFSGYSRDEVLLCSRMLHDFIFSAPWGPALQAEERAPADEQDPPADAASRRRSRRAL